MENLTIEGDFKHPKIIFDAEKGLLELNGNSIPERAGEFYTPIIEWVKIYLQSPCEATTLNFKLIYLNSGSKRYILDILEIVKSSLPAGQEGGSNVTINWYYEEDDEDMLEMGESYKELVDLPINFIPINVND